MQSNPIEINEDSPLHSISILLDRTETNAR